MRPGKKRVDRSSSSTRRDGGVGTESVLDQTNGMAGRAARDGKRREASHGVDAWVARKRGARARPQPESGNGFFSTSNGLSQPWARSLGKECFRSAACMQGLLSGKGDPKADNQPHIYLSPSPASALSAPPTNIARTPSPPHNQSSTCVTLELVVDARLDITQIRAPRTPCALESLLDRQSLALRSARCVARERYAQ